MTTSRISNNFWNFLTLGLAVALLCETCVPGFAQKALSGTLPAGSATGWTQQAELTAPDGATNDTFGQSIAVSGSTLVVGAPLHNVGSNSWQGAAYVFVENGGTWTRTVELIASDGSANDKFGWSVAISGNTILVGAYQHTVGSNTYQGAAYVFAQSGGIWSQQAKLIASDGGSYQDFGYSVAVSGTAALVGAYNHPVGSNASQGSAYVFVQSGTTWNQQAELISSDGGFSDGFGQSVAVSGGTALVGAPRHQVGSISGEGAAYVFAEKSGSWSQQAELTAPNGLTDEGFGSSVAISGTTGVISTGVLGNGENYVFAQSGQTWTRKAELTVPNGSSCGVAADGHIVVTGACLGTGAVNVFAENAGSWSQQAELTASDSGAQDLFGDSVAISGSTVVVGAPNHEVGSNPGQGAAYVFVPSTTTVTLSPTSVTFGNQAINTTSAAKTVTLENTGTVTLYNTSIAITSGSGLFAVSSNTCGATLSVGKTCKVSITFTPTQLAAETGTLTFNDNTSESPQTVSLSGKGVAQATLSPASTTFATQPVLISSAAKTFSLTNNLATTLSVIGITFTGSDPGDFAQTNTCGSGVAAKTKCTISVTFTPKSTGTRTATLNVKDNAHDSPQTANLTGTGENQVTWTPSSLTYTVQKVGTTSAAKTITLTNNLPTTLAMTSITFTGTDAGDFAQTNTCGSGVAAKTKCTISVTFTPKGTGTRTAILNINDSGNKSPQTVPLTGTGN